MSIIYRKDRPAGEANDLDPIDVDNNFEELDNRTSPEGLIGSTTIDSLSFDGYDRRLEDNSATDQEPRIVRLNNGQLFMLYRKSPDFDHAGSSNGKLVFRRSVDNGVTWGNEELAWDDEFDDRNSIVAVMPSGKLVVVFRRMGQDTGYITSNDNGRNWSAYTALISTSILTQPFGEVLIRGNDVVFWLAVYEGANTNYRLYTSSDEFATEPTYTTPIVDSSGSQFHEPMMIDIPNGRSIVYFRNHSGGVLQFNSDDGTTFTQKGVTNLWDDAISPRTFSPVGVIYDDETNKIFLTTTRRNSNSYSGNETIPVRIYEQDADIAFNDQTTYELTHEIPRPKINNYRIYGYASMFKTPFGFIVAMCDSNAKDPTLEAGDNNEWASIYVFNLYRNSIPSDIINAQIMGSKLVVQNGYTRSKDYLDYITLSGLTYIHTYAKTKDLP